MADALVSVILDQLTSILLEQAKNEVTLVVGVDEQVKKLTSNLEAIQAVLEDAERREVKEAVVKLWLDKLKDVSYDMDDVLDEWNTAILKIQIGRDQNSVKLMRKACGFVFSACFCCTRIALRRDIAVKINELNDRLDVIACEKSNYNFTSIRGVEEIERQMTVSYIDISEVHGRGEDKNRIVDMLLNESSFEPTLRVISIVGMGGIGKTTLAQLVYNDDEVNAYFQKRIWVCVSDPFDEIRIAKAILEDLKEWEGAKLNELNSLLQCIRDSIKGHKFLLVLDDVWTEDHTRFEQLKNSLKCGSPGSKILVTTRKETVAITMGTTDMLPLGQLSKEECWSLFSRLAFFGKSNEERECLEDIGRRIADKCKGLPLAAKVLGSLLCFKNTREEWESVLDSEVWKLEEAERGLFPPLLLSYYDLSSTLRRCFSYCAIFPKDYKIENDRLIKLWMAQGYLRATHSKDMEMVGEECFKNLSMRSFFQDFEKDKDDGAITCKMHDIVHDFAQYLTKNECFVMEVNSPEECRLDSSRVKARHSMMMLSEDVSIPASIYEVKNLRSLIVESKDLLMISADLPEVFDRLTCLRTLNLSGHYSSSLKELPSEVGALIHLRKLNLAGNKELKKLPETVSDLCNLQSLNLNSCECLEKLPSGLANLINLRHLELFRTLRLGFMPRGMDRLSSLQILDKFVVSSDGNVNEASTLEDLKNLKLRGCLEISGLGNVRDVSEVQKAQLDNKKHLLSLHLDFSVEGREGRMRNDEQVIEALQPSPNLEELSIVFYKGTSMSILGKAPLTNLKKVQICVCFTLELLPPLGKLSSLESLIIGKVQRGHFVFLGGMEGMKRVGIEFLGIETDNNEGLSKIDEAETSLSTVIAFPKLKHLSFVDLKNWEEWDYGITGRTGEEEDITTSIRIMPCLCYLSIEGCPKLKALPDHLLQTTLLEELSIINCPILKERYKARTGEDWHKISHIPNIQIHPRDVQTDDSADGP